MTALAFNDRYQKTTPASSIDPQSVDFEIFSTADLDVYVDGVETTDFTITATFTDGVSSNAVVAILTPVVASPTVEIVGAREPRRDQFLFPAGAQLVASMNADLARRTAEIMELFRDTGRAVKAPFGESLSKALPSASARANKYFFFDEAGGPGATGDAPPTILGEFNNVAGLQAATVPGEINITLTAGFTTFGDGGGATYKRVGSEPSHALKVQSADGAWWEGVVPFMVPEMFGAVGDGVTDDLTKLQDMFDCPVSDAIMFGAGKTYYFETNGESDNLTITRGMQLRMNGSTLHHKMIGGSSNRALSFITTMGTEETWTETISAYATVLNITTSLAVGASIFIELGEHPLDGTVDQVFIWATITANGGSSITIDKPVPLNINGTSHSIYPVTPNEGSSIDALRIISIGNASAALFLRSVRNFSCESYEAIDVALGLGIIDGCENINIGIMSGRGRNEASGSSGRAFTSWGSRSINIDELDWVHTQYNKSVIFIEAGTTDFHIGKFNLNRVLTQTATTDPIHVSGNGDLHIDQFTLTSNKSDRLIFPAADPFRVSIDDLVIWASITSTFALKRIVHAKRLKYLGKHFIDKVQLNKRTFINGNTTYDLEWFYGVPLRMFARIDDTTKVDAINIKRQNDSVRNILTGLTSGEWVDVISEDAARALTLGTRFRVQINGKADSSAVLDLFVEYWRDSAVTELSELSSWDENRGEVTDTTDGSGDIVIAHGLGGEPRTVQVQMQGTTDYNPTVHTKGATNFTVRVSDAAGAAVTSTAVTVSWSAAL